MTKLSARGSKYSDVERRNAVGQYIVLGNLRRVADQTGIPKQTLSDWKRSEWWESLISELRSEKEAEIQAQLSEIIEKAHKATIDRLDNGDEVHTKDGIQRIKMRGRDTATVAAIAYDKLRLLLNQPTSIKADSSNVEQLADMFRQLSERWQEKSANVVAVQASSEDGDPND